MAKQIGTKQEKAEMSFFDHLEQLRWHIVRSVVAIILIAIVVFLLKDIVFHSIIFGPKNEDFISYRVMCRFVNMFCDYTPEFEIITRKLEEKFLTHIKVSFVLGIIVAFPYIFWELWRFIKPGLYAKEQKITRGIVYICSFLFMSGVFFGYFIISPLAIRFLSSYALEGPLSTVTLSDFVSLMVMFTLPTGIVFELPVLVYFLAIIGVVSVAFLKKYRKHSIVLILFVAAMVTPPDLISQFLIAIPLVGLYEISIVIAKRVEKRKKEEEEKEK
jgi:sec-independent protein translocase protein TatC